MRTEHRRVETLMSPPKASPTTSIPSFQPGPRLYKSRIYRPCDFCVASQVACKIDISSPCELCFSHGRECTFVRIRGTTKTSDSWPLDSAGPLGLNLIFSRAKPHVDFIFVHGVKGGSQKTWSFKNDPSRYWPKYWLLLDPCLRETRVHSFGYASNLENGRLDLHDLAKSLLAEIHNSPLTGRESTSPLVLIGHSIGGLILKKLYSITRKDPFYSPLADRIRSIVFLATPHRVSGSEVADFVFAGSNGYENALEVNPTTIQLINEEFRCIPSSGNLDLHSFYETMPTPFRIFSKFLLSKPYATLGLVNETSAPLVATHYDMCRFESPEDPNYVLVRNALISITMKIKKEEEWKQSEPLRKYLGVDVPPEGSLQQYKKDQTEGSCQWLMGSEVFCNWRDIKRPAKSILWLHGQPGCGKSFLAAHAIQCLQDLELDCGYFFFHHGVKNFSTLDDCFRSLALQMALLNGGVARALSSMQRRNVCIVQDGPRLLWKAILAACMFFRRPCYWIIDALDEYPDQGLLCSLLADLDTTVPLRILLISRSTPDIWRDFSALPNLVEDSISPEYTKGDIALYVEKNIKMVYTNHVDRTELRNRVASTIVEKSEGNFLWASLVLNELANASSEADIDFILTEAHVDMDSLFERTPENPSAVSHGLDSSVSSSVFSLESTNTISTKPTTQELSEHEPGVDSIVDILTTDENLKSSYDMVLKSEKIDCAKFQRNFRRLLRQFSTDLRKELSDDLGQIPRFIRLRKGDITGRIWATIGDRTEGVSDLMRQEPIDDDAKRQRLVKYLSEHFPVTATSLDPINGLNEPGSASESDDSFAAESEHQYNKGLKYSPEFLKTSIRKSEAFDRLRIDFHCWASPGSHKPVEVAKTISRIIDEQDILLNFVSETTFTPRDHLMHASIEKGAPTGLLDRVKSTLEAYTRQPWDWWPLKQPLASDSSRLTWACVSFFSFMYSHFLFLSLVVTVGGSNVVIQGLQA